MGSMRFLFTNEWDIKRLYVHAKLRPAEHLQPGVYLPHLFLHKLHPRFSESNLLDSASLPVFDPMKNRGGRLGDDGGVNG